MRVFVDKGDKMSKIGEILKERRKLEAKSLDDVVLHTMIAKKYIVAFEEDNYLPFPGKIYAKGFLRNYAHFLGFNEDEINNLLSQYELEWQEAHFNLPPSLPKKIPAVSKTNRLLYMIIFILVISFSLLLGFYLTKQKASQQESLINYSDPSKILEEKDISEVEDIFIKGAKNRGKEGEQPAINKVEKVILEAFAFDNVWLQATIDGKVRKEILLTADQKTKWQAKENISLIIGNAGGVVFKLNEQYIGAVGRKGEVKRVLATPKNFTIIKAQEVLPKEEVATSSLSLSNIPSSPPSTLSTAKPTISTTSP